MVTLSTTIPSVAIPILDSILVGIIVDLEAEFAILGMIEAV